MLTMTDRSTFSPPHYLDPSADPGERFVAAHDVLVQRYGAAEHVRTTRVPVMALYVALDAAPVVARQAMVRSPALHVPHGTAEAYRVAVAELTRRLDRAVTEHSAASGVAVPVDALGAWLAALDYVIAVLDTATPAP